MKLKADGKVFNVQLIDGNWEDTDGNIWAEMGDGENGWYSDNVHDMFHSGETDRSPYAVLFGLAPELWHAHETCQRPASNPRNSG